jgi:hypothetical protein
MGSWGSGIFDDDLALDIRAAFEREIESGADVPTATHKVLQQFASAAKDSDDSPVVYLALAALQLELGALQPEIRTKALHIIRTGKGWIGWDEYMPDWPGLTERKQVLEQFRMLLLQHKPYRNRT